MWVRREAWDEGLDPVLEKTVRAWLAEKWRFSSADWPERIR
jgi:hypothetical protein